MFLLWLAACTGPRPVDDTGRWFLPQMYWVDFTVNPDPPVAGDLSTVTLSVRGTQGPVQDLQTTHERVVHTFVISKDLQSFEHRHQEDTEPITADDLRAATFHFPETFPSAGLFVLYFDYATKNQYYNSFGWQTVNGGPTQLDKPVVDLATAVDDGDVHAELAFDVPPVAGQVASFHVHLTSGGVDVTDVVQWLGADSHVAIVDTNFTVISHTHAYFDGMNSAPPDHTMPHLYSGPDIPFEFLFPTVGTYKIWVQFARAANPDVPYTMPFMFEVD